MDAEEKLPYNKTEKGRAAVRRAHDRYVQTEKGKQAQRKASRNYALKRKRDQIEPDPNFNVNNIKP